MNIFIEEVLAGAHMSNQLRCTDEAGGTVWVLHPVTSTDSFVQLRVEGDRVKAWTWSGWMYDISSANGSILSQTFVK